MQQLDLKRKSENSENNQLHHIAQTEINANFIDLVVTKQIADFQVQRKTLLRNDYSIVLLDSSFFT